jgi:adenylate kinase family enzyme
MTAKKPFDRVLIMGNGGSGKTWLAGNLARILGPRVLHLDDIHWEPGHYGVARDRTLRDRLVMDAATDDRWIMEGVYGQLANMVLNRVTTLIWLDLPEEECLANVRQRGIQGGGSQTRFQDLLTWVAEYRSRKNNWNSFEAHQRLFDKYQGSKAHLTDRAGISAYLNALSPQGQISV